MLTSIEKADTTVFKHIVEKTEAEKRFLLNSVNREIKEVQEQWGHCPTVEIIYRLNFDRFYFESHIDLIKRVFHFDTTNDILVLTIEPQNKTLTMKELDELINEQFTEINKALLDNDSIKIPDKISISDFDNLKFDDKYASLAKRLLEVGQLIRTHRLSLFDIDGKTAVTALAYWMDEKFTTIEDKKDAIVSLTHLFQIIILNSYNDWSVDFIDRLDKILDVEFNEAPIPGDCDLRDKIKELGMLEQNVLNIKMAKASIEKENRK